MHKLKQWYYEKMAGKTVESLKLNGFDGCYVKTSFEAKEMVLGMIPENGKIGFGSSKTLEEIGLLAVFENMKDKLITATGDLPMDIRIEQRRKALLSDIFLTSTNAVTLDGKLINIDGTGNRVAAMIFGPKKVVIIAGVNKITKNVEEALARTREYAAVINAKRLNRKTPCVTTGRCEDCQSAERICKVTTIIEKKPHATDISVIIVGEELGY